MVSCDTGNMGCNGGMLDKEWYFLESTGTVTDKCWSYKSGSGSVPACRDSCEDGSDMKFYKSEKNSLKQLADIDSIKMEIMTNGPVETGFTVYSDFMSYRSGIYVAGWFTWPEGGHAVKIVGWGVEDSVNYWIVANSWGASWGENGFFRIDWADKETAIGIGGGFNCGDIKPLPTPKPTDGPNTCKDISPNSCAIINDKNKQCAYMAGICLQTCGCCGFIKPDYCPKNE